MKKILLLSGLLIFMANCRTIKISDFHQQAPLSSTIPPMSLKVHAKSFLSRFANEVVEDGGYYWIPSPYEMHTRVGEPMRDVFTLLGNELADNMAETSGDKYGQVRFKLEFYNQTVPGWGWIIPSISTLNIANVLGMPYTRYRVDLELQMEVLDANQQVLAQYRAPGKGKASVALYYGYTGPDALRKANLLALQEAMRGIRAQMERDLPKVREELLAVGPNKK